MPRHPKIRIPVLALAGFSLFAAALLVLSPAAAYGEDNSRLQLKKGEEFGLYFIPKGNDPKEITPASVVDCASLFPCQFPDPMFEGAPQPAIRFDVGEDKTVHLEFELFDGHDCVDFVVDGAADFPLTAGTWIVFLRFDPPLPKGTPLSISWRIAACETDPVCTNYTMGVDPPSCIPEP